MYWYWVQVTLDEGYYELLTFHSQEIFPKQYNIQFYLIYQLWLNSFMSTKCVRFPKMCQLFINIMYRPRNNNPCFHEFYSILKFNLISSLRRRLQAWCNEWLQMGWDEVETGCNDVEVACDVKYIRNKDYCWFLPICDLVNRSW